MDVTERVQAEEALRTTQLQLAHVSRVTQMGELTASIAHEVNQPLSAVIMGGAAGLRWLDRPIPDLDEVRTALRRIVEDANRAAQVLGRIRALAQQVTPQTSRILVEDVIRDVVEMLEYELTVQGVVLTTALRTHARPIVGDPIQLQQVMLNLIMNAAESLSGARAGERRIDVVAEFRDEEPHGVIVAVRDSGTEPPPENPELLFKPFYTTKASGMGLGLSICRSIVESHGGRLWATANDDRGMTFRFSLPVSDEHGGGHGGGHVVGPRIP
jgi:C4-dicarboxylate-specific signal transduction histidine kinase